MRKNYFLIVLAMVFTVNAMAQNIPSYMPKNGLIGYWPFNGNANDESGNGNNGTVNGATLTADKNGNINKAYKFDGNGFISLLSNSNIQGNKSRSISAWFSLNSSSNYTNTIYKGGNNGDGNDFSIWVTTGTNNQANFQIRRFNSDIITSKYEIQPNEWHLITVTYDGTNDLQTKIYLDGKLLTNHPGPATGLTYNTTSVVPGFGNLIDQLGVNHYLKGSLDDIAIYNRALTQEEVTALYSSTPVSQNIPSYVPKDGLVGYWPFNGNANDESGNGNHGTVNGATLASDRFSNINSSYSFLNPNSKISLSTISSDSISSISISGWFKKSIAGIDAAIFAMSNGCNGADGLRLFIGNDNFLYWGVEKTSCIGVSVYSNLINYADNNWHFFVASYNKSNPTYVTTDFSLWIDGFNVGISNTKSTQGINSPISNNLFSTTIGNHNLSTNRFTGQLDDIAIYNRTLTEQEIAALYSGATNLASTKVFVDAPASVNQNDTLELSISTEALNSSDNVIAFQTDFAFDSTKYTYVNNHVVGTLNANGTVVVNSSKKGKLSISYMSQTALSGAGGLVKLKFKANNTVGQGIFSLANFMYNNTDITSLKSDTVNTIDGIPPSAKLTFSQNPVRKGDSLLITVNFNEKMAITPVPQINLTGQNTLANTNLTKVNDSTYTYWWVVEKGNGAVNVALASGKDVAGNLVVATPSENPSFTVLPTLFGDIDTNKFVRAYDAALALQYSVGLNPLPTMDPLPWSNWRLAVANVDTVGNVTANDASLILQHSAKVITTFPADAKKRGDAPVANITVTQEANQLVFRATGTLYAFNVFMKDNFNAFGQPEVKDKNAMIATNITSTTYNVGLASTTPFTENEPFLVIPILTNDNLQGTMDIVANAQEKALAYGAAASIASIQNDAMVVYPNPTKDVVTINNAQGKTLRIVDFQGRLVNTQIVTSNAHEVSLKAIATKGEYIFQLIGENNETIATQKVVMQ